MIGTCSAEGLGLTAIGSTVVFTCTLSEAAVRLLIQKKKKKKNLRSSMTSLGMEYLSLQMIALLPALDTVLANMCNCWKCNDDYLHI